MHKKLYYVRIFVLIVTSLGCQWPFYTRITMNHIMVSILGQGWMYALGLLVRISIVTHALGLYPNKAFQIA